MDVLGTNGKSTLWNERTREPEEGTLQNWIDDGRQRERVKQSLLFVFLFSIPFFFPSLRMFHGGRVAKTIEGLKRRMEVCVCLKRANFRSPRSLFAWNRTNESKNVVSLVLMSTINKHYI